MSVGEQVIDNITKALFESAKLDPYKFRYQSRHALRKDFDHFIDPYKLTKEEKESKSNLLNIIKGNLDHSAVIQPISRDLLETSIHLEPPRQIREFTQIQPTDTKGKGRGGRKSGVAATGGVAGSASSNGGSTSASTATKRNFNETDLSSSTTTLRGNDPKRMKSTPIFIEPNIKQIALDTTTKFSHTLPVNFYEIIHRLFDEFYCLKFDDKEVNFAFFANITIHNCRDYKLSTFSEHSYSLGVIKNKLDNREYLSIDDFLHDFNQLFSNITKYYPHDHNAYKKAMELKALFDQKWSDYIEQFKWR